MKLTIVSGETDWQCLYIDGEACYENHRIDASDIPWDKLGIDFESIYIEDIEDFPDKLEDLKWFWMIKKELYSVHTVEKSLQMS